MHARGAKVLKGSSWLVVVMSSLGLCIVIFALGKAVYDGLYGTDGLWGYRRVPVPNNIYNDRAASPDELSKWWRGFTVDQSWEEIIIFYQRTLPQSGWLIVAQGELMERSIRTYCMGVEQQSTTADIRIREVGAEITSVSIYIDQPYPTCADLLNSLDK